MTDPIPGEEQLESRPQAARRRRSARAIAAEREQKRSRVKLASVAGVTLLVVVVIALFAYQRQQSAASIPEGTQSYSIAAAQHTTDPVTYAENPPAGGEHHPAWQNCGYYPAAVPNENAVHSLEHGAVWITYQPDLPQDQVDTLRNLAESQSFILISPMAEIPAPVVVSAWGRQLQLDSAADARLDQFIRRFRLSPDSPEPGAACTGGVSATA